MYMKKKPPQRDGAATFSNKKGKSSRATQIKKQLQNVTFCFTLVMCCCLFSLSQVAHGCLPPITKLWPLDESAIYVQPTHVSTTPTFHLSFILEFKIALTEFPGGHPRLSHVVPAAMPPFGHLKWWRQGTGMQLFLPQSTYRRVKHVTSTLKGTGLLPCRPLFPFVLLGSGPCRAVPSRGRLCDQHLRGHQMRRTFPPAASLHGITDCLI